MQFDKEYFKSLGQIKYVKLKSLKNPSQINDDNLNNVKRETSRHFWNKKAEYLKDNFNDTETNSKSNISDLYRHKWIQERLPIIKLIKDQNSICRFSQYS
jgi:hypothetical protein